MLLNEARLVKAVNFSTTYGDSNWVPLRLTWEGHDFLDAARNEDRWKKAKARPFSWMVNSVSVLLSSAPQGRQKIAQCVRPG